MRTFLLEPGLTDRWELVDVDRPERPSISGWLHLDRPVVRHLAGPTPSIPREETQV